MREIVRWLGVSAMLLFAAAKAFGQTGAPSPSTDPPSPRSTYAIVPEGLITYFPADGNGLDWMGNHHATLRGGVSFADGVLGQAFDLNGADGSIDIWPAFDLQTFTFAMWIKEGVQQGAGFIDILDTHHFNRVGIVLQGGYRNARHWYSLAAGETILEEFFLKPGVWQHLVITRDSGGRLCLYLNGNLALSSSGPQIEYHGKEMLRLGRWGHGGRHWKGQIDEFAIYNRALSAEEVQRLFTAGESASGISATSRIHSDRPAVGNVATISLQNPAPNVAPLIPPMDSLQSGSKAGFQVASWNTSHGLPQNTVKAILQTRDGFLWVGTASGLARFDGREFRVFDRSSNPPLAQCNILTLAEDSEGVLWIGHNEGLASFRSGQFQFYTPPPHPVVPEKAINSILVRTNHTLWVCASSGVWEFKDGEFSPAIPAAPPHFNPAQAVQDATGTVWFSGNSAFSFSRISQTGRFEPLSLAGHELKAGCLYPGSSGKLWLGTSDLICWRDGVWQQADWFDEIKSIAEDDRKRLWFGTKSMGVRMLDAEGHWFEFHTGMGLSDNTINCIYPDRDGNIWLGTQNGGLNSLQPKRVVNYTSAQGLVSNDAWSISEAQDGSLWIATAAGVSHFRDGHFTNFPLDGARWAIEDSSGAVWAHAFYAAASPIYRLHEKQFFPYGDGPFGPAGLSTAYAQRDGPLWISVGGALVSNSHEEWRTLFISGPPGQTPDLLGILRDAGGTLWVGSRNAGLFGLQGQEVNSRYTKADGLTSDFVAPVLAETNGTLWIASDQGLNRLKNGKVTRFSSANGLAEDIVLNVLEDDDGWFWLNGHRGIHRVRKQDLNDLAEGKRRKVESFTLTSADGLLSAEGNGGSFPNSCKTRDGRLWFPTTAGLTVIDPRTITHNTQPAPVWIDRVHANDELIFDLGTPLPVQALPPNSTFHRSERRFDLPPRRVRSLQIRYSAPVFTAPERTTFKFRLEGYDNDWREETERQAIYTNLRFGTYRFHVLARSPHGVWNETGDSLSFHFAPFFYETAWFRLSGGAVALLAIGAIHTRRVRVQRRMLKLEQDASLARERERIARDLHDDIGASLTRIAMLSDVVRQHGDLNGATRQVERISTLSREVIDQMSELVWAANPRFDTVESFAGYVREYAAQLLGSLGIHFDFTLHSPNQSARLPSDLRRDLFLILKEALNNSIKHAAPSQVSVEIKHTEKSVEIIVTDNGTGLPDTPRSQFGNGLHNMRARADRLNGTVQITPRPEGGVLVHIFTRLPTS